MCWCDGCRRVVRGSNIVCSKDDAGYVSSIPFPNQYRWLQVSEDLPSTFTADALVSALDNGPSTTLLFVSSDSDVCYAASMLRMRGYEVYIITPSSESAFTHLLLPGKFDWSLLGPSNSNGPGSRSGQDLSDTASRSQTWSSDRSLKPHTTSVHSNEQVKGTPSSPHNLDGSVHSNNFTQPDAFPSNEISEFRERFSRRPTLDTDVHPFRGVANTTVRRPSLSRQRLRQEDEIILVKQPINNEKGKGRAVPPQEDSPSYSPTIEFTTSSISSNSRSSSFDSYVMPQSVSTAPTSAMPFYGAGQGFGIWKDVDGTLKPRSYQNQSGNGPAAQTTLGEMQRTTSMQSARSTAETVVPTRPQPEGWNQSPSNAMSSRSVALPIQSSTPVILQQPSPRYDVAPSFLPRRTPTHSRPVSRLRERSLEPERIQVLASPFHPVSTHNRPTSAISSTFVVAPTATRSRSPMKPRTPSWDPTTSNPFLSGGGDFGVVGVGPSEGMAASSAPTNLAQEASGSMVDDTTSSSQSYMSTTSRRPAPVPARFQSLVDILRSQPGIKKYQLFKKLAQAEAGGAPIVFGPAHEQLAPWKQHVLDAVSAGIVVKVKKSFVLAEKYA